MRNVRNHSAKERYPSPQTKFDLALFNCQFYSQPLLTDTQLERLSCRAQADRICMNKKFHLEH